MYFAVKDEKRDTKASQIPCSMHHFKFLKSGRKVKLNSEVASHMPLIPGKLSKTYHSKLNFGLNCSNFKHHSTVTDLARFLGWSTLHPFINAM